MIKRIIRNVSRGRDGPPSPEFVSQDAARQERHRRGSSLSIDDRPSMVRDVQLALPGQPHEPVTPGGSAVVPIYLDTELEALNLESVIRPTLGRMRPLIREAEAALSPLPPLPSHMRRGSLTLPPAAHLPAVAPQRHDRVAIQPPAIVVSAEVSPPKSRSSSSSDEHNPFELEFGAAREITPMPKRPPMQRKAASYRTQRELPLRVQAVRRSHQEMYARQILAQSTIQRSSMLRRASETDVARAKAHASPPPRPSARAQSVAQGAQLARPEMRSRSSSRDGSRMRHERMPSGPHRARDALVEAGETDFYLMAAMSSWTFDP